MCVQVIAIEYSVRIGYIVWADATRQKNSCFIVYTKRAQIS